MKRSHVAPADFEPDETQVQWAMETFDIPAKEVARQTELWKEHEYKRAYSHWNLAWKRWFRQAEQWQKFERPVKYHRPAELTEAEREQAQRDFDNDEKIVKFRERK